MGNILCRDKTPRRVFVKSPIKGIDKAYDPHLFSNDSLVNGTRKDAHNQSSNNKIFFSTPNLNNNMKSTISLDAKIFDSGKNQNPPIAPPRKKRTTLKKGSTLPTTMPSDIVRNGFKDVFGNKTISSIDDTDIEFIDKEENSLQERSMFDQRTSTPEKKLKVGNRKSDKFFGESLSDHLSDEQVSAIEINTENEILDDNKGISDKKLSFFLMNMLDDIRNAEDEDKYKNEGRMPVDEPLFIARKKEIKHICDDDDHIGPHIHKNEKGSSDSAPPKPDRDFSKFKAATLEELIITPNESIEHSKKIEQTEKMQTKVIAKRTLSRDKLPSPPATPYRKKNVASLPTTPTITIDTIDASIKKATEQNLNEAKEALIDNNITEFVDQVIKKAYGITDINYHPEDFSHANHDDGSNLVTPTSKLAVRKISTPRKISTESAPSLDSENMMPKTNDLCIPDAPYKKSSFCDNEVKLNQMLEEGHAKFYETDQAARIPSPITRNLKVSPGGSSINDIVDEIYSRNSDIIKDFQSFLEQSVEKEPCVNADDEKNFLDAKKSLEDNAEDPKKEVYEDDFDNRSYSDSFESSDNEDEIAKTNKDLITPVESKVLEKRRESIEDVENWFSHHIEMDQKESEVCNSYQNIEQRSSIGYDTNKIFPFGSTITGRRESQSDDFFSDTASCIQRMKHQIESVKETEISILEESEDKDRQEKKQKNSEKESSPDHSTLFKYLDKSNPAENNAIN